MIVCYAKEPIFLGLREYWVEYNIEEKLQTYREKATRPQNKGIFETVYLIKVAFFVLPMC